LALRFTRRTLRLTATIGQVAITLAGRFGAAMLTGPPAPALRRLAPRVFRFACDQGSLAVEPAASQPHRHITLRSLVRLDDPADMELVLRVALVIVDRPPGRHVPDRVPPSSGRDRGRRF
jgi:hypothetical protein